MNQDENSQYNRQNLLTGIRDAYTLAATEEYGRREADELVVKHFLNTLAEIVLSIAARRIKRENR